MSEPRYAATEPVKVFVVVDSMVQYEEFVRAKRLDPMTTWWCETMAEAERDVETNRRQGIRATIVDANAPR